MLQKFANYLHFCTNVTTFFRGNPTLTFPLSVRTVCARTNYSVFQLGASVGTRKKLIYAKAWGAKNPAPDLNGHNQIMPKCHFVKP